MQHKNNRSSKLPLFSRVITILLAIVTVLILLIQLIEPIRSHDIWWHIVLGKQILETGSGIIDHSIFSWTPAITYFVYNSWLSEIILYLIDRYFGLSGLIALRYLIFLGIVALAWHFSKKRGLSNNPLTWPIILLSLSFMWGAALIKPELFTLGFMPIVVWLYYYMRSRGNQAWHWPYAYPILFVLWANMHGAFFVSSLFFIATVAGELLNMYFSPKQALPTRLRKHYFFALALCVPAILLTPYGYELPLEIIQGVLFGSAVAQNNIVGYQPTFLLNSPPLFLLDYLIASMLLFVFLVWQKLKHRQTDWVTIFAYIFYSALFVQMGRLTFYLGPIFLFAALDLLAYKDRSWAWPSGKHGKLVLHAISIIIVFTIAGRAIYVQRCELRHPLQMVEKMLDPSADTLMASADYAEQHLSGNRIGNEYDTGGYLMYRFWPQKKAMIDTRTFPFSAWIDDYFQAEAGNNIEEFLQKYNADFWIVSFERRRLIEWFYTSKQWDLAFIGPNGGVFIPASASSTTPTVISDRIDSLDNLYAISNILTLVFLQNDPVLGRRIYNAGINNLESNCSITKTYLAELESTVTGMEYFASGEFRKAADLFRSSGIYIHSLGKATDALLEVVRQERAQGDIAQARATYLEIFSLSPQAALTDAYNFAILDWEYRHTDSSSLPEPDDDLNWNDLTKLILQNADSLANRQRKILDIAKELDAGTYDGKAQLVLRDYAE